MPGGQRTRLLHRPPIAGGSAGFCRVQGTRRLARHLWPGGVYALWSNDPPDDAYLAILSAVFIDVAAEVITFPTRSRTVRPPTTV